jgi:multicomponent Na+:H+ antiporter subunit D
MNMLFWLPIFILLSSFLTGLLIFFLPSHKNGTRAALNMIGAGLKLVLVILVSWGVVHGEEYETRFEIILGFAFLLKIDHMSLLMVILSTALWFVTTIYSIGYMRGLPNQSRFFGFFSLCVTASVGVALAGNLITFFIFYEILTLTTYPLVVHKGTEESLRAGRTYLWYTLAGGSILFLGIVWMNALLGPVDFAQTAITAQIAKSHTAELRIIFATLIAGLGVKSAIWPLHGWLPVAMIAPAPVSALLHAVAVVKAGVFGILRVVFDVFGVTLSTSLGLLGPLALFAAITIIYGSLRALQQNELKKMLAYSTVSQVSYIILGAAATGLTASTGSLVHLIHQGIMKITLFFCAGIIEKTLQIRNIDELYGVGRQLPLTAAAFTLAALGMIGLPPIAGFVSKWHLALGALEAEQTWIVIVFIVSSLLNAAYFLPVLYKIWFKVRLERVPEERVGLAEAPGLLLWSTLFTAALSLAAGLFASSAFSPLELARTVAYGLKL